jgi:DNA-binding transcriptional LysR family regulator
MAPKQAGAAMTLKQLEVFLAVADTRSFSKGGEAVSLAQSTASQHIRALEDELQARLFDRSASQVSLTEAGRLFYEHASRICRQCSEAQDAVRRFQGLEQATLRVGGSTIPAACLIPDLLARFTATCPGVSLELQQGDTREVLRLLQDELIELAVVGGRIDDEGICFEELQTEQIVLISKPGYLPETVLSIRQLLQLPLMLREPGSGTRQATEDALRLAGLDPRELRIVARLGSSEAVRRAVLGGAGCGFISSLAVGHELQEGSLVAVSVTGLEIRQPFYLAVRRGRSLSPAAEAFKALIRQD